MSRLRFGVVVLLLALSGCQTLGSSEERRIGEMVQSIEAAIAAPGDPESLATVARYGTDTRYYVMIRGWLVQELRGVESQLEASRDSQLKAEFQQKADFLRSAIRRIDLE
ncbi:hypothetical protein RE428_01590 [Marinobacter nanhaiticus D15-8W]|uniref:DUF4296 domain-containing protein n=1 Tax=Marinobacter nanhaiticus D15-8W TaxID=626887 RepID=N6X280_9GAMM|nr:hypothetical protein [Marinobacter nanhaiticus]ENO15158.1 hypothetical protein J057_07406 [Marinobacter nanhaiticus D15-8W]BES69141.1 hypothetical protein RE428_01590 [Marinobacter nanhaiticus D15-8W]